MALNLLKICDKLIEYSFYALFLLVPLVFTSATSELFELNKMWLTFGLTLIIVSSWIIKMIIKKEVFIQKTPLDIPLCLFLLSQIISTVFSIDRHVSLWGYYSRFNGGLLSIASYILLYYAFLSNFKTGKDQDSTSSDAVSMTKRLLLISLLSGLIVALWGLPSHFGYDLTCLLFRGSLDVSCWTEAFKPVVRIFSTLGQPDWLAAYLVILIPIAVSFLFIMALKKNGEGKHGRISLLAIGLVLLASLFYTDLLYTRARSGFLGFLISLLVLWPANLLIRKWFYTKKVFMKYFIAVNVVFLLLTFAIGIPFGRIENFTFGNLFNKITASKQAKISPLENTTGNELGGTNSTQIRFIVWEGALKAWRDNPIFGTGVETFAFTYYKYRPASHNLTSEWDYLYNKAHNEYLNYLTTTGAFGLATYLAMIGWFLLIAIKKLKTTAQNLEPAIDKQTLILSFALIASYASILVTNFFGFSVVIVNIYLFLIPAFVFILCGLIDPTRHLLVLLKKDEPPKNIAGAKLDSSQKIEILVAAVFSLYLLLKLVNLWQADVNYAYAANLDKLGQYKQAYSSLKEALKLRGDEPVIKDELIANNAALSVALYTQKEGTLAAQMATQAVETSNQLLTDYPDNVVFWKSRTRLFYTLSQLDSQYLTYALEAIKNAHALAPTDAKIAYNLGVLYGQTGNLEKSIQSLRETIKLKPDYKDAYYALGLFYYEMAKDKNGNVVNLEYKQKAINEMQYILNHFSKSDKEANETLKTWGAI